MSIRAHVILLGAALLAACGGRAPSEAPDFAIHGAGVFVRSSAAFTQRSDLPTRVESTVDAALAYWGGSWASLDGRTITLDGQTFVRCEGIEGATGCFDGDIRVSTSDLGNTFSCVEQTELVHEVGHAVIGDPDHLDSRWMDFEAVAAALAGRTGYVSGGAADCTLYVSVWRHPPRH